MVNVAAHVSLQCVHKDLRNFLLLEDVLAERARTNKVAPLMNLNVTRIAVLGDIGMELNAARFGAGQVRIEIEIPMATKTANAPTQVVAVLVFDSGKLIFTGGENECVTRLAAWTFVAMLVNQFEIPVTMSCFRINNIVFNYFLNFKVDLNRFVRAEHAMCVYEPAKFPAVIYNFARKFRALVNYTGRVIVTGARDAVTAHNAYIHLYNKLLKFRDSRDTALTYAGEPDVTFTAANQNADSFMRMDRQFTALMETFTDSDLDAIDRNRALQPNPLGIADFSVVEFVEQYKKLRPAQAIEGSRVRPVIDIDE